MTLDQAGAYTIVVGPYEGIGVEGYTITIEGEEPAPPTVEEPDFRLSADGAIDKGALTINVDAVNEIEGDDERHVYTFRSDGWSRSQDASGDGRSRFERQWLLCALRHRFTRPMAAWRWAWTHDSAAAARD